jgi:hypothetical protein
MRSEEDGSTLYIYIWRQNNDTCQIQFEWGEEEEGESEYNGGDEFVQDTV